MELTLRKEVLMGCLLVLETRGLGGQVEMGEQGEDEVQFSEEHRPNDSGCPGLCHCGSSRRQGSWRD